VTKDQEARLEHAYADAAVELEGVWEYRNDPVGSREALRMTRVRVSEMGTCYEKCTGGRLPSFAGRFAGPSSRCPISL
jgi:hypothetical protein